MSLCRDLPVWGDLSGHYLTVETIRIPTYESQEILLQNHAVGHKDGITIVVAPFALHQELGGPYLGPMAHLHESDTFETIEIMMGLWDFQGSGPLASLGHCLQHARLLTETTREDSDVPRP